MSLDKFSKDRNYEVIKENDIQILLDNVQKCVYYANIEHKEVLSQ